tara:strand:- start:83 stop:277 length:195 start_codon:yes stop_codon:yes gene_type:complete
MLQMSKRTYEKDGLKIEIASDLDDLVVDKRKSWRANSSKANQRQRRYKKRLTKQIIQIDKDSLT